MREKILRALSKFNMSRVLQTDCGGTPGWGRKRREVNLESSVSVESRAKRQVDDTFDIGVGGKVNIVEKYSDIRKYDILKKILNVRKVCVFKEKLECADSVCFYRKT